MEERIKKTKTPADEDGQGAYDGYEAPKKKAKKPQVWDKEGCPRYVKTSEAAKQGEKAALQALKLQPTEMSMEDENVTMDPSQAAAIKHARAQTQAQQLPEYGGWLILQCFLCKSPMQ